jgi:hypothetical protein
MLLTLPSLARSPQERPLEDLVSRNAIGRFETSVEKRFGKLEGSGKAADDEDDVNPKDLEEAQRRVDEFLEEWCALFPPSAYLGNPD